MREFARLLNALVYTSSRNAKLRLLADYFRSVPDPDRGYALAALSDGLTQRFPLRRVLADLLEPHVDPVLYRLSRDYVGDTAETVALLWPEKNEYLPAPSVSEIAETVTATSNKDLPRLIERWLDTLDSNGRWALLKLLTGALRVGVSARLAKTALAQMAGRETVDIEEVWHGLRPPYLELFAWLEGRGERPDPGDAPVFRPLMLSHPIEETDWPALEPGDICAEWKWDGIRVQLASNGRETRLYSRAGDDISSAFPEIVDAFAGLSAVADGELLVVRDGDVAPFNDLQKRLNRKTVTAKMLKGYPAHIKLYDLLFAGGEDLRGHPLRQRRQSLEGWHGSHRPQRCDLSDVIDFADFDELRSLWHSARAHNIEGLMLKRWSSPYLSGRPKGHWYKWKRAPLTIDCVMMYAQRGSGKRSSYHSDYTFGTWRAGDDGARELVPVGKAYSGFTDEELLKLDRWVRNNTTERYGPVRAVRPGLVLEVAFDAVQPSKRHKSGVAMRFPRIHRIRWDKPAEEADTLETLKALIIASR